MFRYIDWNVKEGAARVSMSIDLARRILEASKQRAKELRSPISIAIVDAGGHLVLFERMMSPYGWATVDISIAKAATAVMFNQPTDAVAQWAPGIPGFAASMATMSHGKFIMAAGGWPIRTGGATIGGIGVSGGNAPGRDDEIARAGIAVLEMQQNVPAQSSTPPLAYPAQTPRQSPSAQYPLSTPQDISMGYPSPPSVSAPEYPSPQSPSQQTGYSVYQGTTPEFQPLPSSDQGDVPTDRPSSPDIQASSRYLTPEEENKQEKNDESSFSSSENRPGGRP